MFVCFLLTFLMVSALHLRVTILFAMLTFCFDKGPAVFGLMLSMVAMLAVVQDFCLFSDQSDSVEQSALLGE